MPRWHPQMALKDVETAEEEQEEGDEKVLVPPELNTKREKTTRLR